MKKPANADAGFDFSGPGYDVVPMMYRPRMPTQEDNVLEIQFKSSNVRSAKLDRSTGVVEVEFSSGDRYGFANFTEKQLTEWSEAKSAGSWFDANVKKKPQAHPVVSKSEKPMGVGRGGDHLAQANLGAEIAGAVTAAARDVSSRSSATEETARMDPEVAKALAGELAVNHDQVMPDVRANAKLRYEAYVRNSGGKAWDGKPCPEWKDLGNPVRSHWCAVVLDERRQLAEAGLTPEEKQKLVIENLDLKKRIAQAEGGANHRLEAAVLDRTKLEASETEKLRAQVAELEGKLRRSGSRPWRDRADRAAEEASRTPATETPPNPEVAPPTDDGRRGTMTPVLDAPVPGPRRT